MASFVRTCARPELSVSIEIVRQGANRNIGTIRHTASYVSTLVDIPRSTVAG